MIKLVENVIYKTVTDTTKLNNIHGEDLDSRSLVHLNIQYNTNFIFKDEARDKSIYKGGKKEKREKGD